MPITVTEFEAGTEPQKVEREDRKPQILQFLKDDKKNAFTQKEVADHFSIKSPAARTTLVALVDQGCADRKSVPIEGGGTRIYYAYVKDLPPKEEKQPAAE